MNIDIFKDDFLLLYMLFVVLSFSIWHTYFFISISGILFISYSFKFIFLPLIKDIIVAIVINPKPPISINIIIIVCPNIFQ